MTHVKMKIYFFTILLVFLECSNAGSAKNKMTFNCESYKQYSVKQNLKKFTVENIDYKSIDTLYKSTKGFSLLENVIPDEQSYFYSHLEQDCKLVLLSKSSYDGKAVRLYLVNLTQEGAFEKIMLLAEKSSYPGSFSKTISEWDGNRVIVTKVDSYVGKYLEDEDRYSTIVDSVAVNYSYKNGLYKEVSRDSVRTLR